MTSPLALAATLALPILACAQPQGGAPEDPAHDLWFHREPWRSEEPAEEPAVEPVQEDGEKRGRSGAWSIPGPMPAGEWKTIPWNPGASSDTITLSRGETGYTVENAIVQASARTAFIAYQNGGPYRGTRFSNCIVRVEPGTVPEDRSYWAMRGYDMIDTELHAIEITGFGKPTKKHDEGHAIYFNVAGAFSLTHSNIHHNGGQALQLVNRPYESTLPPGKAAGSIEIINTWFHENGFNPDRAGFQVSIFGTGQDVRFDTVEIIAGHDTTAYDKGLTGGALLIEAEYPRDDKHNAWWAPWPPPKELSPPFTQGTVELTNVLVDHKSPNRPIVQISGCKELIVRDSEFNGGKVNLDDPSKAGRSSGRIVWEGNDGDAVVFLSGERLGPANEDFIAENGKRL